MAEVDEQVVDTGNIPPPLDIVNAEKNKFAIVPVIIVVAIIICLIIVYFTSRQTSPVKPLEQKQQVTRLTPAFVPLSISEKPQTEILMDIKDQLVKAFK